MTDDKLMAAAKAARENAYCPYSGMSVGAALLASDGRVYTGCNIENAAFGPTVCAERVAVFRAVSEGVRAFSAIAVSGGRVGEDSCRPFPPCGVCRQVLAEFCDPDSFRILLESGQSVTSDLLSALLPRSFRPSHLKEEKLEG